MVTVSLNFEQLFAVRTVFGPHLAVIFVISKLHFSRCKLAVLANDWHVSLCFMFRFICLSNNLAAFLTLVINPGALHFVHSEFGCLDAALAVFAQFGFFRFNHYLIKMEPQKPSCVKPCC